MVSAGLLRRKSVGGRGKAGGVRLLDSRDAVVDAATELLGTRLVTYQTDETGQLTKYWLAPSHIARELFRCSC